MNFNVNLSTFVKNLISGLPIKFKEAKCLSVLLKLIDDNFFKQPIPIFFRYPKSTWIRFGNWVRIEQNTE
jgi:hypothetical protein